MNMHLFGYIYMFSQIHVHVHNVASDIIYMYLDIIQEKGACESLLFILNCACTCSYNVLVFSREKAPHWMMMTCTLYSLSIRR